jgi:hypothetical protein
MKEAAEEKGPSCLDRVLRMENFLGLVGVGCIVGGVVSGIRPMSIFYGICIIVGSIALHFVKKKNWEEHWAQQERVRKAYEQRMAEDKKQKEQ